VTPFYIAGWLNPDGSIRSGTGFDAGRFSGSAGVYQIQVAKPASGRFVIPTASTFARNTVARIVSFARDAFSGVTTIIVEVRTLDTNTLVDGDVLFIIAERS